jgi:predicted alpha/beta-hydrolase family hydrolase
MINRKVGILVDEEEKVSGVVSVPRGYQAGMTPTVILAHGAGNDMENPLIVFLSQGLCVAGYLTLRFNFPYKERGRKTPDPQKKLVQTWKSVCHFLKKDPEIRAAKIVAAGKSMGGRVASQMAADGVLAADYLVFLGYPLHSPGKKHPLRDEHLYRIQIPMFFITGSRDMLCDLALLKGVLGRLDAPWTLEVIEGGDHSLKVPKSTPVFQEKIYDRILKKTVEWLEKNLFLK